MTLDPILDEVLAYMAAHNLTRSAAGAHLANDPSLVFDLERGREPRRALRERIKSKMQQAPEKAAQ